jgi:Inner membrane protein YgaP-like, transmembrane domain
MKKWQNESRTDRMIRLVVALAAAFGALNSHGSVMIFWWVVCAIAAISGLSGFALPYKLFGISTQKKPKRR